MNPDDRLLKSLEYRKAIVELIKHRGPVHAGGSLSCVDVRNIRSNPTMNVFPDGDRFVQKRILLQGLAQTARHMLQKGLDT